MKVWEKLQSHNNEEENDVSQQSCQMYFVMKLIYVHAGDGMNVYMESNFKIDVENLK